MEYKSKYNASDFLVLGSHNQEEHITVLTRELDIRVINEKEIPKKKITTPESAANLIRGFYNQETLNIQEQFLAVYLNRQNQYLGHYINSKGGITGTVADVRLMLVPCIKLGATAMIISHNHPSGNTQPSGADKKLTEQMAISCKSMGIDLLDHIIVTEYQHYSFADNAEMPELKGIEKIEFKGITNNKKTTIMKITRKNYFSEFTKADKNAMPKAVKETHELIAQATNDGKDWSFFDVDAEMKEVEVLQMQKFEEFLNKTTADTIKEKEEDNKPKFARNDRVIKKGSTEKSTKKTDTAAKTKKRKPKYKIGDTLNWYDNDGITHIREKISSIGYKTDGEPIYTVKTSKETWQYSESEIIEAIKNKTMFLNKPAIKYLEDIDIEVKYITRYKNLHNKVKTRNQLLTLLTSLQKSILKKQIRKNSTFASEIEIMQDGLITIIKSMKEDGVETVKVVVNNYDKYKQIADSHKRLISITYIMRYISMANKADQEEKAKRLLTQIENALKSGKIGNSDNYYKHIERIRKNLTEYIKQGNSHKLEITETELNGLQGIITSDCKCNLGLSGTGAGTYIAGILTSIAARYIYDTKVKPEADKRIAEKTEKAEKQKTDVVSSSDMQKMKFDVLNLTGEFKDVIGSPTKNAIFMITGEPGSGKSTFALLFSDYMAEYVNPNKILYITKEEGVSQTFKEKLDRYNAYQNNLMIAEDIPDNLTPYQAVVFDSVQSLNLEPEDIVKNKEKYPETMFIYIFHVTKNGQFRGKKEFEHHVDCVIEAKNGIVSTQGHKNRFGARGEMKVF